MNPTLYDTITASFTAQVKALDGVGYARTQLRAMEKVAETLADNLNASGIDICPKAFLLACGFPKQQQ